MREYLFYSLCFLLILSLIFSINLLLFISFRKRPIFRSIKVNFIYKWISKVFGEFIYQPQKLYYGFHLRKNGKIPKTSHKNNTQRLEEPNENLEYSPQRNMGAFITGATNKTINVDLKDDSLLKALKNKDKILLETIQNHYKPYKNNGKSLGDWESFWDEKSRYYEKGRMGIVIKTQNLEDKKDYALKIYFENQHFLNRTYQSLGDTFENSSIKNNFCIGKWYKDGVEGKTIFNENHNILIMPWEKGDLLDQFISNCRHNHQRKHIIDCAREFRSITTKSHRLRIVHGDLCCENIFVEKYRDDIKIKIIDTDSLGWDGHWESLENIHGQPNFQREDRINGKFDLYQSIPNTIDYVSEWIIYMSLIGYAILPPKMALRNKDKHAPHEDGKCLAFNAMDFSSLEQKSSLFDTLKRIDKNSEFNKMLSAIHLFVKPETNPNDIRPIEEYDCENVEKWADDYIKEVFKEEKIRSC